MPKGQYQATGQATELDRNVRASVALELASESPGNGHHGSPVFAFGPTATRKSLENQTAVQQVSKVPCW